MYVDYPCHQLQTYFSISQNDLSPCNIMVEQDGNVVLIDFATVTTEGSVTGVIGTDNFSRMSSVSDKENDLYSLERIRRFLDEGLAMVRK